MSDRIAGIPPGSVTAVGRPRRRLIVYIDLDPESHTGVELIRLVAPSEDGYEQINHLVSKELLDASKCADALRKEAWAKVLRAMRENAAVDDFRPWLDALFGALIEADLIVRPGN